MDDRDKALDALRKNGIEIQSQKEEIEEASVRGALRRTAGLGRRLFDPSDLLRYPKGEVESRGGQFRPKGSSRGAVRRVLPEARGARVRKLLDAAAKKRKSADKALGNGKPDEAMALRAEARALEAAIPTPEMASPGEFDVPPGVPYPDPAAEPSSVLAVIDGIAYMKGKFSDGSNAIVARSRDGKAVGYLSYQTETETVTPGVEDRKIVLFDVKVAPDYRRRGIATRLVEQAQAANPMALTQTNARTPDGEALFASIPGIEVAPEFAEDMGDAGPPIPFPDWVVEKGLEALSMRAEWVAEDVRKSGLDDSWTPEAPEGGYASGWELGEDGEWVESGKMGSPDDPTLPLAERLTGVTSSPLGATELDPEVALAIEEALLVGWLVWPQRGVGEMKDLGLRVLVSDDAESKVFPDSKLYVHRDEGRNAYADFPMKDSAPVNSFSAKEWSEQASDGFVAFASSIRALGETHQAIVVRPSITPQRTAGLTGEWETPFHAADREGVTDAQYRGIVLLHEVGHTLGAALAYDNAHHPRSGLPSYSSESESYIALFEEYGITPQQVATVSRYGTTSPSEAFAEIYAMYYGGLIGEMDPDLRDRFEDLMRDRVPGHATRNRQYGDPAEGLAAVLYQRLGEVLGYDSEDFLAVRDRLADGVGNLRVLSENGWDVKLPEPMMASPAERRMEVRVSKQVGRVTNADGAEIEIDLDYAPADGAAPGTLEYREAYANHITLVRAALNKWGEQGTYLAEENDSVGFHERIRAILEGRESARSPEEKALAWEMLFNARRSLRPLYRGQRIHDSDIGLGIYPDEPPDDVRSWTTDPSTAEEFADGLGFASDLFDEGDDGSDWQYDVVEIEPGEGLGIPVNGYFGRWGSLGVPPENFMFGKDGEWILWPPGTTPETDTADSPLRVGRVRAAMASPDWPEGVTVGPQTPRSRDNGQRVAAVKRVMSELVTRWPEAAELDIRVYYADDDESTPFADYIERVKSDPAIRPGASPPPSQGRIVVPYSGREIREVVPIEALTPSLMAYDGSSFGLPPAFYNRIQSLTGEEPSPPTFVFDVGVGRGRVQYDPTEASISNRWRRSWPEYHELVARHEVGHLVADTILFRRYGPDLRPDDSEPAAQDDGRAWYRRREDRLRQLLVEYGITPEEIASVTPYATASPHEAFAEMYAAAFSPRVFALTAELREKFLNLIRSELPEHSVELPEGAGVALGRFAREMASPDDLDIMVERRQPYEYPGPEVHDQNLRGELIDWLVFQAESAAKYPNSAMRWEINNGDPGPGPFFRGQPPTSRGIGAPLADAGPRSWSKDPSVAVYHAPRVLVKRDGTISPVLFDSQVAGRDEMLAVEILMTDPTPKSGLDLTRHQTGYEWESEVILDAANWPKGAYATPIRVIVGGPGEVVSDEVVYGRVDQVLREQHGYTGPKLTDPFAAAQAEMASPADRITATQVDEALAEMASPTSEVTPGEAALSLTARAFPLIRTSPKSATKLDPDVGKGIDEGLTTVSLFWYGFEEEGIPVLVSDDAESKVFPESSLYLGPDGLMKRPVSPSAPLDSVSAKDYASGLGGGPDTLASASRHLYPEEVRQEVILVDPGRKGAAYRVVGPGTETPEFVHNQAITRSGVASMTIIHEIGHIVGHRMIENLTGSITGSAEEDEQGYRAIFDRYGITPEEIASVSRYGTTSLVEAFAELYGAYYGGLIDDLDPDLRDKFEQAITDLMPDHDIRDKTYDTPSVGLAARLYEKMLFVTDARWSDPAGRAEMEGALAERLSPLSTDQRAEVRRRYAAGDMASPEIPPSLDYEYEVDGRRIRAVVRFADVDASVRRIGKQGTTTRVIGAYRAEPRLFPTPSGSQLEWVPVGAVTIDRDTGDLALIGVDASMRGQGFASELLRVAREYTGLPLDKADPMVSESGRRLAAREGIYVEEDTDFGPQVTPDEAAESWWNRVASAMAHPAREVEWLDGLETEDEFIAAVKRRTEMASPGSEPTVSTEATSNLLRERPEFAASLAVAIEEARGRWPGLVNVPVVVGDDAAPIFPNASGITVKSSIPRGDGGRMLAGIRMVPELPPGGFTPSVEGEAIETAPTSEVSAAWLWSNDADRFTSLAVSLNSTDAIIVNPSVREWDWAIEEIVGPLYIEPPADGLPPLELVTGDDLLASVITHEYGHIIGKAVIRRFENEIEALSERSWSELSELPEGWSDPYKRMFDEYGITPEEIADVSEYATTSPSEAFAEMYVSRFIDHGQFGRAMDPVLREKFDRLLATELPDHALPEPRGGAEIEMASPDGSALPATAALGIRTSRVTPLAEKFPEQVRGIDEEVRAFAERWPEGVERLDYLYLSDDSGGHPLREGTSGSLSVTTVGTRSGDVLSTERGIKIEPSRIGTPAGATVGGTLLAKLTGEELTRDTKLSNGNVVASWGFWHSYGDFDLSAFDFPVTPEQLDQAHRLITIHELGHVVGEAIIPFRDDFRDADYQVLLQKYGITPEEIAAVSEYATTAAIEAFAEIYAMRFSEMADQMDPFLREKFDALLRAELPGHRVPDAQMTLPLEMASPESALPVVMALDNSLDTSPVTPLAERFPEQVTIIEEEFQELDSRWPGWKFYLDHLRFSDDKAPITTTWGEQDTTTLTKETTEGAYQIWWHQGGEDEGFAIQKHRGMTLRPSRRGSTSHGTPGILLERLTGTDLSRTLVNYGGEGPGLSSSYDQWRRAGRDDLTQTGLATAEQLDRAFRVVVAHEIGHLVGEAILPYGEAFDPGQPVAAYQRLFEKYEITPQEIAGVSEYATVHPMEAFAEIYAMMFSELVDEMDPDLREKFARLLRERLPEHQIPDFSREPAILTA